MSTTKYGFFYRFYVFAWFQATAILETIFNTFDYIGLYKRKRAKMPESLHGKTVMITGANSGIGKETALACAQRGAKLILACRDLEKAKEAIAEILEKAGSEAKKENLTLVHLDLSSLQSVRNCARQVADQFPVIDILINNAGLMMCPEWKTVDGVEYQLGTNHLGHFLLTHLLIDRIRASPAGRIVNLSSVAHMPGYMTFENFDLVDAYTPFKAYARSKLANILFTRELARRLVKSTVTVYACHPGMVNTELKRHLQGLQKVLLAFFNKLILISPEAGAQTTLYCAFDEEIQNHTGFYYDNCTRVSKLASHVTDDADATQLWELSLKLCNIENNNLLA